MALSVKIEHPAYPEGYEFGVEGLGTLKNGETKEITEEQEQTYVDTYGRGMKDAFSEAQFITMEGEPTVEAPEMPEEEGQGEEEAVPTEEESSGTEEQEGSPEESATA